MSIVGTTKTTNNTGTGVFVPRDGAGMVRFDKPCVSASHALKYFKMHMTGGDYLTEQGQAEMV